MINAGTHFSFTQFTSKGTAMKIKIVLFFCTAMFLLPGCSKKGSSDIKEWETFQDSYFRVTFNYPKDWYVVKDENHILIYNSVDVADKFFTHDPYKPDGVQIIVGAERSDTVQDYVKYMDNYRADMEAAGFGIKSVENAKMDGLDAKEITYSGSYDERTKITAVRAATLKDSTIYYVQYAAFNDLYAPYRPVFDSVMATLVLPKPKAQSTNPNAEVFPEAETKVIKNSVLDITVPGNMMDTYPAPKGDVTFAMSLKIYRNDCTIDIDVRSAKKLTLDKVVDQNSKKIKNASGPFPATIGSEKAKYFNYSLMKGVKSRIYFIVKNDKIYRVIMNYYAPMEKDFLPAFEKAIASIRIK
jgi:hypothetical protein